MGKPKNPDNLKPTLVMLGDTEREAIARIKKIARESLSTSELIRIAVRFYVDKFFQ